MRRTIDAIARARWITRERVILWGIAFTAVWVILTGTLIVAQTRAGTAFTEGGPLVGDFINSFAGARLAAGGRAQLAYDGGWFSAFEQTITGPSYPRVYSYSPIAMLLSLPLALFSFVPALIVWDMLGTGFFFLVLRRLIGWRITAVAAVAAPAAFFNLFNGQNGYFTAGLLAGGLMVLDRRPLIAGICFGCLSYKPQMAVLLPFALAAGGRWRILAIAGATALVLGLASLALFGSQTWVAAIGQMAVQRQILESDTTGLMPTVFAALRELGVTPAHCSAAQIGSAVLALAAVLLIWRSPGPIEMKFAVVPVATFLATPYAWMHDALTLTFAAAWLAREGLRTAFLPWERIAIVALLVFPLFAFAVRISVGIQFGPVVLWLVLLALVRRSRVYRMSVGAGGVSGAIETRGAGR